MTGISGGPAPTGPDETPAHASPPGERKEVGGADSSKRHPPHHTELPANAHGSDKADMTEQPAIRDGSMYEQRPDEDKNRPPSERTS